MRDTQVSMFISVHDFEFDSIGITVEEDSSRPIVTSKQAMDRIYQSLIKGCATYKAQFTFSSLAQAAHFAVSIRLSGYSGAVNVSEEAVDYIANLIEDVAPHFYSQAPELRPTRNTLPPSPSPNPSFVGCYIEALRNPVTREMRVSFSLWDDFFVVVKFFPDTNGEKFSVKVWHADYEVTRSHWSTTEPVELPYIKPVVIAAQAAIGRALLALNRPNL